MIDFPTYRQLHPESKSSPTTNRTEIPRERMDNDEPPTAPEIFLFPPRIVGFNLRRKKWGTITPYLRVMLCSDFT
jgi:hypothetical protein